MSAIGDLTNGFNHPTLAQTPGYADLRRSLAAVAEATDLPLHRFLTDVRAAALTSLLGALCPTCGDTCWPFRGNRRRTRFLGTYMCETCSSTFKATTDLGDVAWQAPTLPRDGDGTRSAHAEREGQATESIRNTTFGDL